MAELQTDSDSVTLGIPTVGAIRVSHHGVEVMAPESQHDAVEQRLRVWAVAQFLLARGWGVTTGSVVTRRDAATAIIGPPRSGVTLLALALCDHGFALASDGIVVWDSDSRVTSTPWRARIDAAPAAALFRNMTQQVVSSGRARVDCGPAPAVGLTPLTSVVYVHDLWDVETADVVGPRSSRDLVDAGVIRPMPALVPGSTPFRPLPEVPAWMLARPVPRDMDMMQRHAPHRLAERVAPLLPMDVG